MAIIKEITLENGVVINYHRVVSVNNVTNQSSIIEVAGYTGKAKREEEKEKIKNNEPMNIFIFTKYIDIPYNADLNVSSAYEYIKTLSDYSGCTDDN